jgi:peptidyl-prolyl cis-trans isomerase A (cyclophilin A)
MGGNGGKGGNGDKEEIRMSIKVESSVVLSSVGVLFLVALGGAVACTKDTPPEPESPKKDPAATGLPSAAPQATLNLGLSGASTPKKAGGDPLDGVFTMADATRSIPGSGALQATIETSAGTLKCKLYEDKAPLTVANFIGLATGQRTWKDPSGAWVNRPAYDGTTFHRIIKGFMIQGGDSKGNGSGEPGYTFNDEYWEGATHDRAGLLCMANRGPNTNGAQFFVMDGAAAHLDRDHSYTVFGDCGPLDTVHAIANVPVMGEAPVKPITIKTIKIAREKSADAGAVGGSSASSGDAGAKKKTEKPELK